MNQLSVHSLSKRYHDVQALNDVSLDIDEGEFFCVVGPTNAGKSTLLKTIAGVCRQDKGTIRIQGNVVTHDEPRNRDVSLLFQNIALFPNLSGYENLALPLKLKSHSHDEIKKRVGSVAEVLRISHLLDRLPVTFSGGEQQRVAIGRAMIQPGKLLMLDEPLTNLDARIRIELRIEFKKLHQEFGQTILYVTHDQVEAMSLSDRIGVLHQGSFQQIGSPRDIYTAPENRFVATFIGQPPMNIFDVELKSVDGVECFVNGDIRLPCSDENRSLVGSGQRISLGIRPETVDVSLERRNGHITPGKIVWIEHLGHRSNLDIRVDRVLIRATVTKVRDFSADDQVWLDLTRVQPLLLNRDTNQFINDRTRTMEA